MIKYLIAFIPFLAIAETDYGPYLNDIKGQLYRLEGTTQSINGDTSDIRDYMTDDLNGFLIDINSSLSNELPRLSHLVESNLYNQLIVHDSSQDPNLLRFSFGNTYVQQRDNVFNPDFPPTVYTSGIGASVGIAPDGIVTIPRLLLSASENLARFYSDWNLSWFNQSLRDRLYHSSVTNSLYYHNGSSASYNFHTINSYAGLDDDTSYSSRLFFANNYTYNLAEILRNYVTHFGWVSAQQSYFNRDYLHQLQDIRRLLAQNFSISNSIDVVVSNSDIRLDWNASWRGLEESWDIGRLWSESAITPNIDAEVIQQTYFANYDDLSHNFFEAVPELILAGVRQRKSSNTSLYNILTNLQVQTDAIKRIAEDVHLIASNFNVQAQVDSSEVQGVISESGQAVSSLRLGWQTGGLRSDLDISQVWGDPDQIDYSEQFPEYVTLDFSDVVHDVNWGFFNYGDMSPNDFVFTLDLRAYRNFFSFMRYCFVFFYACISLVLLAFIFFIMCKLWVFITTIVVENGF